MTDRYKPIKSDGTAGQILIAGLTDAIDPKWQTRVGLTVVLFQNGVSQIWTNAGQTIEELFNTAVNRKQADLTNFRQYRIVAQVITASSGANALLGAVFSLDASQLKNLADGVNDTIEAVGNSLDISTAAGVIIGTWTDIDASALTDVLLSCEQTCDVATGDPAFTSVEIQFR